MKRVSVALIFLSALLLYPALSAEPHHASLATLSPSTRTMFLNWMDATSSLWDPGAKLLRPSRYEPGLRKTSSNLGDWHYWEKCCYDVRGTSY